MADRSDPQATAPPRRRIDIRALRDHLRSFPGFAGREYNGDVQWMINAMLGSVAMAERSGEIHSARRRIFGVVAAFSSDASPASEAERRDALTCLDTLADEARRTDEWLRVGTDAARTAEAAGLGGSVADGERALSPAAVRRTAAERAAAVATAAEAAVAAANAAPAADAAPVRKRQKKISPPKARRVEVAAVTVAAANAGLGPKRHKKVSPPKARRVEMVYDGGMLLQDFLAQCARQKVNLSSFAYERPNPNISTSYEKSRLKMVWKYAWSVATEEQRKILSGGPTPPGDDVEIAAALEIAMKTVAAEVASTALEMATDEFNKVKPDDRPARKMGETVGCLNSTLAMTRKWKNAALKKKRKAEEDENEVCDASGGEKCDEVDELVTE